MTITGNAAPAGADGSTPGTPGGPGSSGGGIHNLPSGNLTVTDSTISGNAAGGGGVGADGTGSSGAAGGRGGNGGGIDNDGGTVTLVSSTISGNTAGGGGTGGVGDVGFPGGNGGGGGDGGGIWSAPSGGSGGSLTAKNVTVSGNLAGAAGGGAQGFPFGNSGVRGAGGGVRATAQALLTNTTIAANSAGGSGDGVDAVGGSLTEYGSVIAANGTQNCIGTIADDGYDVTYPGQGFSDCPGVVADPKLGQFQLNGGGSATIALAAGSSAIDIEPAGGACPATDERGVTRPQHSRCDAGAYESAPPDLVNATAVATGATTRPSRQPSTPTSRPQP